MWRNIYPSKVPITDQYFTAFQWQRWRLHINNIFSDGVNITRQTDIQTKKEGNRHDPLNTRKHVISTPVKNSRVRNLTEFLKTQELYASIWLMKITKWNLDKCIHLHYYLVYFFMQYLFALRHFVFSSYWELIFLLNTDEKLIPESMVGVARLHPSFPHKLRCTWQSIIIKWTNMRCLDPARDITSWAFYDATFR